jgi:hypothetical protein
VNTFFCPSILDSYIIFSFHYFDFLLVESAVANVFFLVKIECKLAERLGDMSTTIGYVYSILKSQC